MTGNENVMAVKSCKSIEDELSLIDRLKGERDCYKNELKYANNEKEALNKLCREQKAEIERLEIALSNEEAQSRVMGRLYKQAKAEAIKEFAEKIKQVLELNDLEEYNYVCKLLDILVKEMVGDGE